MQMELEQRGNAELQVTLALSGIIFPKGKSVDSWGDPLQPCEWGVGTFTTGIKGGIGVFLLMHRINRI